MSGNVTGGRLAADKNLARDPDFYKKIGTKGGKAFHEIRGFQAMPRAKRVAAGRKGGAMSRRGKQADGVASLT